MIQQFLKKYDTTRCEYDNIPLGTLYLYIGIFFYLIKEIFLKYSSQQSGFLECLSFLGFYLC